jgi:hypothetical protein
MSPQVCEVIEAKVTASLLLIAGWCSPGVREQSRRNVENQESQPRARNSKS